MYTVYTCTQCTHTGIAIVGMRWYLGIDNILVIFQFFAGFATFAEKRDYFEIQR